MRIIAFNNSHDSSITALENGKIVKHFELEKILGIKHFCGFDYSNELADTFYSHCLPKLGWNIDSIDIVGFSGHSEFKKTEFYKDIPEYNLFGYAQPWVKGRIKLRGASKEIDCYAIIHHVNHLASAYYCSPFTQALIYSHDGLGDKISSLYGIGINNKLIVKSELTIQPPLNIEPNAIGLTYSYLGRIFPFLRKKNGAEDLLGAAGVFMGLSAYGVPIDNWRTECRKMLINWMPEPNNLPEKLGISRDNLVSPDDIIAQNLAATIQDEAELLVCETIKKLFRYHSEYPRNLCMAGGASLNVCINSRLLNEKIVDNLFIQPACSDAGLPIGTALFIWHDILDNPFKGMEYFNPFNGDEPYNNPNDAGFDEWMKQNYPNVSYIKDNNTIANAVGDLIGGGIIAWCYGPIECGPRALGARSLISAVTKASYKDRMNSKIKHRQPYRPFANFILESEQSKWYDINHSSWYMLECPKIKDKEHWDKIPAVVHADGTSRIQTISEDKHPLIFKILTEYFKQTGIPTLMNTSLNDHQKPIAGGTKDVLNLLLNSELDVAYIEGWRFTKKDK